jgi:hypothetical protein
MVLTLAEWAQRRQTLAKQIDQLGDFRPGSITSISGSCGKPECRCHRPGESGHGPNLRLTYKVDGKSVSESLSSAAAMRKAEREVAEYRKYQQLSREFVEAYAEICRLRPIEEDLPAAPQKNGGCNPSGSRTRNRSTPPRRFQRTGQDRASGSGSGRDGGARSHAPCRLRRVNRAAAICRSGHRRGAHDCLRLWPARPLP